VSRRLLVAGIGNIFFSDDGFGVEVAQRLTERKRDLPPGVRVEDFGIRGVHLAYELLEGYDALVLIDALPMGEPPGTLVVMAPEPDASPQNGEVPIMDAHTMSPTVVLSTLARLGGHVARVYVVGCQPATLEEGMALSAPVAGAVEAAVDLCLQLVAEIMEPAGKGTPS
jgi:hydrogenase maturation protease